MSAGHRMPFGKYRGRALRELPDSYVTWLRGLDLREPLRTALLQEVERRRGNGPDPKLAEDLVERGRRSLAKSLHPDIAGGSHDQMLALQRTADWLLRKVSSELRGIAA